MRPIESEKNMYEPTRRRQRIENKQNQNENATVLDEISISNITCVNTQDRIYMCGSCSVSYSLGSAA